MKTTIKYLMLALVAVFACVSISSCSKDDYDPNKLIGNYYFQLSNVETNCYDADGNNIADAAFKLWISTNKANAEGKITVGKVDIETASAFFDQNIKALVEAYDEAYRGKNLLPKNGYINYYFRLGSDAPGVASRFATIEVTNSGAHKK